MIGDISSQTTSAGSPRSPYLVEVSSEQGRSILLDRINAAALLDDELEGRRKIASLLSKYAIELNQATADEGEGLMPLMHAAIVGNSGACLELIAAGASGDARNEFGWSCLHFCAAMGKDRCCSALVKSDIPIDQQDNDGFTPLCIAAMRGHNPVIDVLSRHGHSINCQTNAGATPLILAAQEGRLFTIKRLLHLGADINIYDVSGASALTVCARSGHTNIAKALLDAGADANHCTLRKVTCLNIAVEHGRHNFCRTLLQHGAVVDSTDLKKAAEKGIAAVLTELLPHINNIPDGKAGRKILMKMKRRLKKMQDAKSNNPIDRINTALRKKTSMSLTPALHAASRHGHACALKLLLDHGAYVDACSGMSDGFPALHRAIKFSAAIDAIETLIDAGADVTAPARNRQSYTPLLLAVVHRRLDVCKMLLNYDPKLLLQVDVDGNSVLHLAALNGDNDICRLLLLSQAKKLATLKNKNSSTALSLACMEGRLSIVEALLDDKWGRKSINTIDATRSSPLMLACKHNHPMIVHLLISKGAFVNNAADGIGATPLHAACDVGSVEIVSALLDAKANARATKLNGSTPLHIAARHGHVDVTRLLLTEGLPRSRKRRSHSELKFEREAFLNAPMRRCGSSPLFLSIKQDHDEVSEVLIKTAWIDLEMQNADGDTVLMVAVLRGNVGIAELLKRRGADPFAEGANGNSPMSELKRRSDGPLSRDMLAALLRPADLIAEQSDDEHLLQDSIKKKPVELLESSAALVMKVESKNFGMCCVQ